MQDTTELSYDDAAVTSKWLDRPPVVTDNECSAWLLRDARSAGVARTLLRRFLNRHTDGERYISSAELVVSELVANAILHGWVEESDTLIFLRFEQLPGKLRVEVHDASAKLPNARAAAVSDECGRGLFLVERLALAWGCGSRDGVGKQIWAEVGPADRGEE